MAVWVERVRGAFSVRENGRRLFVAPEGHLRALDGVRALSVLWVVVFHAGWYSRFSLPQDAWVKLAFATWMLPVWRGDFGVDVFFVLSGFLIAGMLLDERARTGDVWFGLFYLRRLFRLWPALLVVAGLDLLTDDPNRHSVWANALYVNDFLPVGVVALGWTWSLAIEEQFYLLCPWLLEGIEPLSTRARLSALGALMAGLVAVGAWVVVDNEIRPWDAEIVGNLDMIRWGFAFDVFYDKPWMRAGALVAGVAAAVMYRTPAIMVALGRGGPRTTVLVGLALVAMGLATHWPLVVDRARVVEILYLASFRTVFAVGAASVILVTLSTHPVGRALARPLSSRVLYPFSQLAYSAYLLNPFVTIGVDRLLTGFVAPGASAMRLLLPCDLVATFAFAAVLHLAVERPFMNLRPRPARRPARVVPL